MKMYRIAHKVTARGVYSHNTYCFKESLPYEHNYLEDISESHDNKDRTPCRYNDEYIFSNMKEESVNSSTVYIYGFNTIQQLKDWFSLEERLALEKLGFHVLELEVEEFCLYKKQMIVTLDHYLDCKVVNLITLEK